MAEGFLKGIWGKPAQQGTGVYGLWGTIKKIPRSIFLVPGSIFKVITTPAKLIMGVIILIIGVLLYKRIK